MKRRFFANRDLRDSNECRNEILGREAYFVVMKLLFQVRLSDVRGSR